MCGGGAQDRARRERQRDVPHPGRQKQNRGRRCEERAGMGDRLANRAIGRVRRGRQFTVTDRFSDDLDERSTVGRLRSAVYMSLGRIALQGEREQQYPRDDRPAATASSKKGGLNSAHRSANGLPQVEFIAKAFVGATRMVGACSSAHRSNGGDDRHWACSGGLFEFGGNAQSDIRNTEAAKIAVQFFPVYETVFPVKPQWLP